MSSQTQTIQIEIKRKALANPRSPDKLRYDLMLSADVDGITYSAGAHYFTNKKSEAAGFDFGGATDSKGLSKDSLFIGSLTDMTRLVDGIKGLSAKDRELLKERKSYINNLLRGAFIDWDESVKSVEIVYETEDVSA